MSCSKLPVRGVGLSLIVFHHGHVLFCRVRVSRDESPIPRHLLPIYFVGREWPGIRSRQEEETSNISFYYVVARLTLID